MANKVGPIIHGIHKQWSINMTIDEKALTKGELRKLNALRKSVGDKIGEQAFSSWLKQHSSSKKKEVVDPVAEKIEQALSGLAKDKTIRLGNFGYSVRRSKGPGTSRFVVTKNVKK